MLVAPRGDRPQRHGVDADPAWAEVDAERPGEPLDRGLRRRIGQRPADRALGLVRGDVDDRAGLPSREHPPSSDGAAHEGGRQVGVHQLEDLRGGACLDRGVVEDRGVVDPTGEGRRALGPLRGILRDAAVRSAAHDRVNPVGIGIVPGPGQAPGVDVDEDDVTAIPQQALGDCSADALTTAGHHVRPHDLIVPGPGCRRQGLPVTPISSARRSTMGTAAVSGRPFGA